MSYKIVTTTTPTFVVGAIFLFGIVAHIASGSATHENCGRVPIHERKFGLSFNKTADIDLSENSNSDDTGGFRILYGLNAVPGEWPFIVRINMCGGGSCSYCTGSLLNSRWILSAGHCGEMARNPRSTTELTASIGLYDLVQADKTAHTVKLDKVIMHPDYSLDPLVDDLALFRTERVVELNDYIQPVCLIDGGTKNAISYSRNRSCYVVGYGMVEHDSLAVKLQKLQVGVREPGACNSDTINDIALKRNTLCIGPKNEKNVGSSCRGDSGGPNICYEAETNRWRLFGTVSYGPSVCDREAGDRWLSVATDLAAYRSWILKSIEADSQIKV